MNSGVLDNTGLSSEFLVSFVCFVFFYYLALALRIEWIDVF